MTRYLVLFLLLALLLPGCSVSDRARTGGPLPPVTAQGSRLLADGRPFEVRGVNYITHTGADALSCPEIQFGADPDCPWDIAPIRADLDRLRGLGVNTVRVFLNYYVFGGARAVDPNYRMDSALAHLDALIAEADARGIYVLPVLMAKYPQDRFGPDAYATVLELHVRPVVRHLAGRPALLMWDLFNEPDIGSPVDQRCWDWDNADFPLCFQLAQERLRFVQVVRQEVKRLDPQRLTTVSLAFAKNYVEPHDADLRVADLVDVLTFHYYDNDPYDSGRYAAHWYYGQGFPADLRRSIDELHALTPARPVVLTEIGFPTGPDAKRNAAELHRDLRAARDLVRAQGAAGVLLWPFQTDPDVLIGDLFTR